MITNNEIRACYKLEIGMWVKNKYTGDIGIIKDWHQIGRHCCYVVYDCNNDWVNYDKYSSIFTEFSSLQPLQKPPIKKQ